MQSTEEQMNAIVVVIFFYMVILKIPFVDHQMCTKYIKQSKNKLL